ncbi:hypothetical protein KOR34_07730 [Posidoniimonas corsicana]|uniref:Uncharacterized protein n=1 Tax=Posidoniimonas corsicana TaxID=1938618 RepID=A0A5C5VD46_9BACT|nr:hypothetical protein [Posidoniimonas corsicana]TWT35877.1 hypothetical protein KOR34_07730 [Posidoniimonas corsicana]
MDEPYYLPSPEEYEAAKAAIRARWTPEERLKRLRFDWRPGEWGAPLVELGEFQLGDSPS